MSLQGKRSFCGTLLKKKTTVFFSFSFSFLSQEHVFNHHGGLKKDDVLEFLNVGTNANYKKHTITI